MTFPPPQDRFHPTGPIPPLGSPHQHPDHLTSQYPAPAPPARKGDSKTGVILALIVSSCLIACCGGTGVVAVFADSPSAEPTGVSSAQADAEDAPETTAPAESSTPTATTPAATASPSPLATTPATRPSSRAVPAAPPKPAAPYYANCTAARAAGAAPIHRGEPGYRPPLDRDNDGIACEESGGSNSGGNNPAPAAPPAAGTDPQFGTCKAAKAAGYGPYVQGQDPEYNWYRDADNDGIVCE